MKNGTKLKILYIAPLPLPLGGMASYMQGLLNSKLVKWVDMRVVRSDYLGKEDYRGITVGISVNFTNNRRI